MLVFGLRLWQLGLPGLHSVHADFKLVLQCVSVFVLLDYLVPVVRRHWCVAPVGTVRVSEPESLGFAPAPQFVFFGVVGLGLLGVPVVHEGEFDVDEVGVEVSRRAAVGLLLEGLDVGQLNAIHLVQLLALHRSEYFEPLSLLLVEVHDAPNVVLLDVAYGGEPPPTVFAAEVLLRGTQFGSLLGLLEGLLVVVLALGSPEVGVRELPLLPEFELFFGLPGSLLVDSFESHPVVDVGLVEEHLHDKAGLE
mmetsp:Transcript_95869/g.206955  ORF Transcript_95869/g.206955 Transcript_95869/m.206955 type:complete len:250 (-) Transcript_95869:2398-3147(-)